MTKRKSTVLATEKADRITSALDSIIAEMAENPAEFVANPDKDFTRNRTLTFERMVRIILSMGGNTLDKELYDYFKNTAVDDTTKSAFVQQRDKIRPEAFSHLFYRFNEACQDSKTYEGYHLYACDGTTVNVAKNPANKETHVNTNKKSDGFNQYHVNTLYDLMNKTYVDAVIQGVRAINEPQAAADMINRLDIQGKVLFIGDRGYAALNLIEHCNRKNGVDYLIRTRDTWITEVKELPMEELDVDISFELRTTQTNADKEAYRNRTAKHISGKSTKGKNKATQYWDFETPHMMKFRIVRLKIAEDTYETIVTSLDRGSFPMEKIKELYRLRWGIETSFRKLKYATGLVNFHARKDSSVMQEIYASLIMYNFSERIVSCAVFVQSEGKKHVYRVNFTTASYMCKLFCNSRKGRSAYLLTDVAKHMEPVRDERIFKRSMRTQSFVNFIYRVA